MAYNAGWGGQGHPANGAPGYGAPPGYGAGQQIPAGYGYAPRPGGPYPGPPRRSSSGIGWIIGVLGVIAVVAIVGIGTVAYVINRDVGVDDMAEVFPTLVKPRGSGERGTGYDNLSCAFRNSGNTPVALHDDSLDLGDWVAAWDCWGEIGKPSYVVLAYPDRSDVVDAVESLPTNTKSFAGDYNGYSWANAESERTREYWKAHAFPSGARSNYLVVAYEDYWSPLDKGKTVHDFDRWCVAMLER